MAFQNHPTTSAISRPSVAWSRFWGAARILMALAIIAATIEQTRLAGANAEAAGLDASFGVVRLFSFFTVLSNVFASIVLLAAGLRSFARRGAVDSPSIAFLLAAASTYMLITGIVYNVVLKAAGGAGIMLGWSNDIHHLVAPVFMLMDLLVAPNRRALRWRSMLGILAFPLVWTAFTLVRGPFLVSPSTGEPPWYPYPFLNPLETAGGYLGVGAWVAGIALVIMGLASFVIGIGKFRADLSTQ